MPELLESAVMRALLELQNPTAEEVARFVRSGGERASTGRIISTLLSAEKSRLIVRSKDQRFDEYKPLTTVGWTIRDRPKIKELAAQAASSLKSTGEERASEYAKETRIVVSQPTFAFGQIENLKKSVQILEVREAFEKIILDSRKSLRIISPFYDSMFVDILARNTATINSLSDVRIMADREKDDTRQALARVQGLFPSAQVKYLYRGAQLMKVGGIHAKMLVADDSEALLGSFNLTMAHVVYNIDVGLMVSGQIVKDFIKLYDAIWEL